MLELTQSLKILITPQNIISIDDSQFEVTSDDINALLAVVNSKCRTVDVDYWMPICLPSVSQEGYINMYYRSVSTAMGLILVSTNADNIAEAVVMCQKIEISLQEEKLTEMIVKYAKMLPLEPSSIRLMIRSLWIRQYRESCSPHTSEESVLHLGVGGLY